MKILISIVSSLLRLLYVCSSEIAKLQKQISAVIKKCMFNCQKALMVSHNRIYFILFLADLRKISTQTIRPT
jgi:hypothetical protein